MIALQKPGYTEFQTHPSKSQPGGQNRLGGTGLLAWPPGLSSFLYRCGTGLLACLASGFHSKRFGLVPGKNKIKKSPISNNYNRIKELPGKTRFSAPLPTNNSSEFFGLLQFRASISRCPPPVFNNLTARCCSHPAPRRGVGFSLRRASARFKSASAGRFPNS